MINGKQYCLECSKEIRSDDYSFRHQDGYVCGVCNSELSGLNDFIAEKTAYEARAK